MGWIRDDGQDHSYDHEGYIQAKVQAYGLWRDRGGGDEARTDAKGLMLQVACTCGWRSQRQTPPLSTGWFPCVVVFSGSDAESFEDAAAEMWNRHMADVTEKSGRMLATRGYELRSERFLESLRAVG